MVKNDKNMIYNTEEIPVCFFRSAPNKPARKILIQITERCNLHCKHCFVDSGSYGNEMKFEDIKNKVLPALKKANVTRVSLTGGEPMVHKNIMDILDLFNDAGMHITLCTNGTLFNDENLERISKLNDIHINVSLDGFSPATHGKFRGNESQELFNRITGNIQKIGKKGLLNGILCTPNNYSDIADYQNLAKFAKDNNAKYLLMNPLSNFGRGEQMLQLGYSKDRLRQLQQTLSPYNQEKDFMITYIRFPVDDETKKLSDCNCDIPYIFTDGSVATCPYLVFATNTTKSKYQPKQFLVGNAFDEDFDLESALDIYELPKSKMAKCKVGTEQCSRGCKAIKVANGQDINSCDFEMCNK